MNKNILDINTKNKLKYSETLNYLTKFKHFRKKCKITLNKINEIISDNTIKDIFINKTSDSSNKEKINKLIILNHNLKYNLLLMIYYLNKMNSIYSTIK